MSTRTEYIPQRMRAAAEAAIMSITMSTIMSITTSTIMRIITNTITNMDIAITDIAITDIAIMGMIMGMADAVVRRASSVLN